MTRQDAAGQDRVLRRKLAESGDQRPGGDWAARAWRVAFPRAAREGIGLDLSVQALRDERQSLAELLELLPDRALLAVLEGPGSGLGLLAVSGDLLAAVIEMQTLGRCAATPARPRRPTRTDAALTAGLVDRAMALLDQALARSEDLTWAGGFRYASFLDEPRALGLLLDDLPYRLLGCDLDIGTGPRQGRILLALPAQGRGPRPALPPPPGPAEDPAPWQGQLQSAVMAAEVTMIATIGCIRLPLGRIMALAPGMVLPLTGGGLDQVALLGPGGAVAGRGRLGQHRGQRALKLGPLAQNAVPAPVSPPEPAAQSALPDAARQEAASPPIVARSA